ncbi:MAG: fibronectin type III domain-containing protein [Armatimonadota bacterium]
MSGLPVVRSVLRASRAAVFLVLWGWALGWCLGVCASSDSAVHSGDAHLTNPESGGSEITFYDISVSPLPNGDYIVRWVTNVATTSKVKYGLTPSYSKETPEDPRLVTSHEVILRGLEEGRIYHFRVCGAVVSGYTPVCSPDGIFYTLSPPSPQLLNESFEECGAGSVHCLYPWIMYTTGNETVGYRPIDGLVGPYAGDGQNSWIGGIKAFDGSYFLGAAANWGYKNGGVFQRVLWPAGQPCCFSVRYVAFNCGGTPNDTLVRVGIDPDGGIDPNAPSVRWWTAAASTNYARWQVASILATAGPRGVVTVFIDIRQRWELEWHVVAVDHATLTPPRPVRIGELKNSLGDFGVILYNKVVTFVSREPTTCFDAGYYKAYVQEDDRSAGIAVYFDASHVQVPQVGERVNIVGSLVNHKLEAVVLASEWNVVVPGGGLLPLPVGISTRDAGGVGTPVQPSLFNRGGLCNVGLRVRVFGRVKWVDCSLPYCDATAIIDDGSAINNQLPSRGNMPRGLRVKLPASFYGVQVGDYVMATGVVSVELVDPKPPPHSGDEYYSYTVLVSSPEDWQLIPYGGVSISSSPNIYRLRK